jgi:hypothetical protein
MFRKSLDRRPWKQRELQVCTSPLSMPRTPSTMALVLSVLVLPFKSLGKKGSIRSSSPPHHTRVCSVAKQGANATLRAVEIGPRSGVGKIAIRIGNATAPSTFREACRINVHRCPCFRATRPYVIWSLVSWVLKCSGDFVSPAMK